MFEVAESTQRHQRVDGGEGESWRQKIRSILVERIESRVAPARQDALFGTTSKRSRRGTKSPPSLACSCKAGQRICQMATYHGLQPRYRKSMYEGKVVYAQSRAGPPHGILLSAASILEEKLVSTSRACLVVVPPFLKANTFHVVCQAWWLAAF